MIVNLGDRTSTLTESSSKVKADQNSPEGASTQVDPKDKKRWEKFRHEIDVTKNYRRKLIQNWSVNIDARRGKPSTSQSDDEQIRVNKDWPLTKTKGASLFSQVPKVRVNHPPDSLTAGPWVAQYERLLNDTLVVSGIEAAMDECLPDCINASGFGAVIVSYEAIMEDKEVPAIDLSTLPPEFAQEAAETQTINGQPIPMETVPTPVDKRYVIQRISPSDFLWPISFTGSNFDHALWKGRSGRITWSEALRKGWVKPEEQKDLLGDEAATLQDSLIDDVDREGAKPEYMVGFDEIFYREHFHNDKPKSFTAIHHMVFIHGKDRPVVDEPWKGQKVLPDGSLIGAMKEPIRVLTLAYLTDEAIPPSDSSIGRMQVNELNKSRNQNILQRDRSLPVRWVDINRTDPAVLHNLMRGTYQGMIPVQGDGSRIIGEVARANTPPDNTAIDAIINNDLNEEWSIGPNQVGSGADVETKGESGEIAANFQTRIGRERARVAAHFVGIAEVLGGLMCLYEDPAVFGEGFDPKFSVALGFSILADSTLLVDSNQRLERLNQFVNTYAKTGFVNLEPVLKEIATLSGLDPSTVIQAPPPATPPPPNVSIRISGLELKDPLLLATALSPDQKPTPELIKQAIDLIQQSVVPNPPPPVGPDGQPLPPTPDGGVPPEGAGPEPPPVPVGEANPEATVLPKITKRSDDPSIGGKS